MSHIGNVSFVTRMKQISEKHFIFLVKKKGMMDQILVIREKEQHVSAI